MVIKKTVEQVINEEKPRYNAYQCGYGVRVSEKYKGRKSKKAQKEKNELKGWCY